MVFQLKWANANIQHNPSQAFSQNMCHTHRWPQQTVSNILMYLWWKSLPNVDKSDSRVEKIRIGCKVSNLN